MNQYHPVALERLYQAIKAQAEQEFLAALRLHNPAMTVEQEATALNRYRLAEQRAELRMIEQSRGNEG